MRKILLLAVLLVSTFISQSQYVNEKDKSVAEQLVRANKDAIGLFSEEEGENLIVQSTYVIQGTDIRMAYMQQSFKGIPVHNRLLVLAFKNGKLVSNAGELIHSMYERTANNSGLPSVQASDALSTALIDRKLKVDEIGASTKSDDGSKLNFGKMGISTENITAELLWLPSETDKSIKLVWQFFIVPNKSSDMWLVRVDANTNQVLAAENLMISCSWENTEHSKEDHFNKHHDNPGFSGKNFVMNQNQKTNDWRYKPFVQNNGSYRVVKYPAESPLHPGGTPQIHTNPWTWAPGNATTLKWNSDGVTDFADTRGNNVLAAEDLDGNNIPGLFAISSTPLPDLTFDFTPNFTVTPTQTAPAPNQQFAITNLFYWNNLVHDITYVYGFDEASGNFQANNLGRGGAGNDRVNADAQNPGNCNANFGTPIDGTSPRMQMFLCTNTVPARDGDADNAVITHEYGHGISTRLTGGPLNSSCLGNSEQMGEGWSDFYGLMLTRDWATATINDGFNNPIGMGTYLFGQATNGPGIRPTRYSTNFAVNPTTYANVGAQVIPHGVGYVWCTMLWEMTWEIIQTAGINPNLFNPAGGGGNAIALKLVQEGLRLQPCSPGFVDGRNAILRADTLFFGGQYSCAILKAFARRGLGYGASQGSSNSITDGVPSFLTGGPALSVNANLIQALELQNIVYTSTVTAICDPITGFTLTDTLPTHLTYVSGGSYNPLNRVVTFSPVNVVSGSPQTFQFTVNVDAGSYFASTNKLVENVDAVVAPALPAAWTAATTNAAAFWRSSVTSARSAPNSFFVNDLNTTSDVTLRTTTALVPVGPSEGYNILSFWHRYNTELDFDFGKVEVSTNGGGSWIDLGPFMTQNGYNNSGGFTGNSGAAFIETKINMASFSGNNIMIRFRFTSDVSVGGTGWFVDDITLNNLPVAVAKSNLYNGSNVLQLQSTSSVEIINACTAPAITTQPISNILCTGSAASFSVVATGNGLQYQWEISTDAGATWNPIAGATASTYTIAGATSVLNGRLYRCVISGTCGNLTSNAAHLYVSPPITHTAVVATPTSVCTPAPSTITGTANGGTVTNTVVISSGLLNIPVPDNTPAGINASLSAPAINFAAATNMKVQVTVNSGHSWVGDLILTLTSPCGTTYLMHRPGVPQTTFGNNADFTGTYLFDLAGATIIPESGGGIIPPGTYQPSNDANPGVTHPWTGFTFPCSGAGAWTLNVSDNAGGDLGTLESWALVIAGAYRHTLTGSGTIVQNASTGLNSENASFTVTNAVLGVNSYTLTSTDILGCSVSSNITLTTSAPPVITVQPVARVICQGANTTFNITATGVNLTYQWQLSTDLGVTWNNIPGATTNSTAITGATLSQSGHQYRCVVTSACGFLNSNAVTLDVTPNPIHTSLTANPNPVCAPGPSNLSGTAVGGTLVGGSDIIIATSGVINLAIPDAGAPVTNNITMPAFSFAAAANLKLRLNINHTWVGDLRITVTNPCGTTTVFDRPGVPAGAFGNSSDLSGVYIFDIGAATVIPESGSPAVIPAGSYRPSDVNGAAHSWAGLTFPCTAAGTWTISVQDNGGGDIGTLVDWAILGPAAVGQYTHSMTGPFIITQNASTGGPSNPTGNFTVSNLGAGTQVYNLTTTDSRGCFVTSPISFVVNPTPNSIILPSAVNVCLGSSTQLTVLDTTKVFTSTTPIAIPGTGTSGNGAPYPGTISVSGLSASARVRSVSLIGLSHTFPADLDILVQSPNGTNVILMSDRGGGNAISNVDYTFLDGAPALGTGFNPTGTYSPTNTAGPDNFPTPGPGSFTQINPTLALFNTATLTPNGTWNILAVDDLGGDIGSLNGWSITFDVPGSLTITYTWSPATGLSSTTGNPVTASPIVNTTYNVTALNRFGCTSSNQGSAVVTVLALPAITSQPTPATQIICPGLNVSYTVGATGAGLTYQWRKGVTNLVNGGNVSGATSTTLTLTGVSLADAATYTVVVSGTCTPSVTSNGVVLQIGTAPTISTQPAASTVVCERYTTTIGVVASAVANTISYKWQVSTDNITFVDLANTSSASIPFYNNVFSPTLTIGNAPLSINGRWYRCFIVTNCNFSIISGSSQLTVNATPVVTAVPITARVCYSDTLVALSGSPAGGVWTGAGVSAGTNIFLPYNASVGTFPIKYKVTNSPSGCADSAIINIKVEDCAERVRLLSDNGVLLYPNPNNGQFNLRVNSTLYRYLAMKVYTSSGQMVKQQQWSNLPYGRVLPVDIRRLPAAVYMVYVYYDDGVRTSEKTFKVIVPAH